MRRGKRSISRMLTGLGLSAVLCFGSLGDSIGSIAVLAAGEEEEVLSGGEEASEDVLPAEDAEAVGEEEEAVSAEEPEDGGEAEAEEASGDEDAYDEEEPEDEEDPADEPESDGLFYIEDEDFKNTFICINNYS